MAVESYVTRRKIPLTFAAFLCLTALTRVATAADAPKAEAEEWKPASHSNGVVIYSRIRPPSSIKEFKATGEVAAAPATVLSVIDDIDEYPHFMPYLTECRIVKRETDSIVSYQRISPPFCTDRDYTIRVRHETRDTPAGRAYVCRWEAANALGPTERSNVVRVNLNEGSWLLEPAANHATRVTYCVYTDSGGALPAWLANKANQIAIGKLFEAIRKQVKLARYTATHPLGVAGSSGVANATSEFFSKAY